MERNHIDILVENLNKYMKLRNKTISDICREQDIPYTTMKSLINRENKDLRLQTAKKICKSLDITLDELMCTEDEIKEQRKLALENIKFANVSSLGLNLEGLSVEDIDELQRIANYMKNKK